MNSTTRMLVDQIVKRGWYEPHQTLGEGGWRAVRDAFKQTHQYAVQVADDEGWIQQYTVYATSDDALRHYVAESFIPGASVYAYEVITEYRDVEL